MNFKEALEKMKEGYRVKRPHWSGYWEWNNDDIIMHTCDFKVFRLLDTDRPEYTFDNMAADDFIIADESNTTLIKGERVVLPFIQMIENMDEGSELDQAKRNLEKLSQGVPMKHPAFISYIEYKNGIFYGYFLGDRVELTSLPRSLRDYVDASPENCPALANRLRFERNVYELNLESLLHGIRMRHPNRSTCLGYENGHFFIDTAFGRCAIPKPPEDLSEYVVVSPENRADFHDTHSSTEEWNDYADQALGGFLEKWRASILEEEKRNPAIPVGMTCFFGTDEPQENSTNTTIKAKLDSVIDRILNDELSDLYPDLRSHPKFMQLLKYGYYEVAGIAMNLVRNETKPTS